MSGFTMNTGKLEQASINTAYENGVTLINPWGYNDRSGRSGESTGATFTMSWDEFYANFGDVTVGQIP